MTNIKTISIVVVINILILTANKIIKNRQNKLQDIEQVKTQ